MFKNSKLSRYRALKILECFCLDIDATKTAYLLRLNRKTVNRYFLAFRKLIHRQQNEEKVRNLGSRPVDVCTDFRNRPSAPAAPAHTDENSRAQYVFGICECHGRVFTELLESCNSADLQAFVRGEGDLPAALQHQGRALYDGLVDVGQDRHFRIRKAESPVPRGGRIDGIEAFWSFTKRRLAKFNGVPKNFELHLKECEWRYGKTPDQLIADLRRLVADNRDLLV